MPPEPIANLSVQASPHDNGSPTTVTLAWENPTNADLKEVVITTLPTVPNAPFKVPKDTTNHTLTFAKGSLASNQYIFTVVAVDQASNQSSPQSNTLEIVDFVYEYAEHSSATSYTKQLLSPVLTLPYSTNVILDADPVTPGNQSMASNLSVSSNGNYINITNVIISQEMALIIYFEATGNLPSAFRLHRNNFVDPDYIISGGGLIFTISNISSVENLGNVNSLVVTFYIKSILTAATTPSFTVTLERQLVGTAPTLHTSQNGDNKFELVDGGFNLQPMGDPSGADAQRLDYETAEFHILRLDVPTVPPTSYFIRVNVTDVAGQ